MLAAAIIGGMVYHKTILEMVEQWSPKVFLAAGGLFALPAVVYGLNTVTGLDIAVPPAVIFLFMMVVFVGLLGLYPRIADQDSTLANGGVVLLAVTAAIIISTFGVSVLFTGPTLGKSTVLAIILTVGVGSILTVTTFGVASLRTDAFSDSVGGFLLVMAAAISFIIVATLVASDPAPAWVGFVGNGLVATSLVSIGHVVRTEDVLTKNPDGTGDVTAS